MISPGTRDDWDVESEEFYSLMQVYRFAPISDQQATVKAYDAIKEHIKTWVMARVHYHD